MYFIALHNCQIRVVMLEAVTDLDLSVLASAVTTVSMVF